MNNFSWPHKTRSVDMKQISIMMMIHHHILNVIKYINISYAMGEWEKNVIGENDRKNFCFQKMYSCASSWHPGNSLCIWCKKHCICCKAFCKVRNETQSEPAVNIQQNILEIFWNHFFLSLWIRCSATYIDNDGIRSISVKICFARERMKCYQFRCRISLYCIFSHYWNR